MITTILTALTLGLTAKATPIELAPRAPSGSASMTPHDKYSSSIGVLGCKINTNRVAYWPSTPDCNNMCVKVSHAGRSLHLLHIDQSGGAHDISYDAWNELGFGVSATQDPRQGGGITMDYEYVDMSHCADLLDDGASLGITGPNPNFLVTCPSGSWAAQHVQLWNIYNQACTYGYDEKCELENNYPTCPHTLGATPTLEGEEVYDIQYGTGKKVLAT